MIIRFGCSNYKSIYGYQELLFTASSLKDQQADLIKTSAIPEEILPSIAIYGANASGKTNMIAALRFFVNFIRSSYRSSETIGIKRSTFKLNTDGKEQASEFDLDFILSDKHYHYGFKINDESVIEEWLYSYTYEIRKSRKILFHRSNAEEKEYKFSKYLKGENIVISKLTRANSLYLSTAAQNNHELLSNIYDYFLTAFSFRFDQHLFLNHIAKRLKEYKVLEQVNQFLKNSGAGIEAIRLKEKVFEGEELFIRNKALEFVKGIIKEVNGSDKDEFELPPDEDAIELVHKDEQGKSVTFDLEEVKVWALKR